VNSQPGKTPTSLQQSKTDQRPEDRDLPDDTDGSPRRAWVTWVLALLTVPAAAAVMIIGIGAAMSVAACSRPQCPDLGPSGLLYGVLLYGAPVVAVLTIALTFMMATRRWGVAVPLGGLALLLADVAVMALLFRI
jgi:hypothetical protein